MQKVQYTLQRSVYRKFSSNSLHCIETCPTPETIMIFMTYYCHNSQDPMTLVIIMTIIIGEMKGFMIDLYGHAFMVFNSQMQIQMQNA